ncbi:MAG: thioredoxin domain-containing protein [Anaerolineae bacterium]|nr:thioredoxin domain-containing protein [Anaerolineae bacterium]
MLRRIVIVLLLCSFAAVGVPALAQTPTPAPTQVFNYWDAGIRLEYPADWAAPQIVVGQAFLAPVLAAGESPVNKPFFAVRLVDPQREFNLAKDAPLEALAQTVALSSGFSSVEITESATASVATVEAWVVRLAAKVPTSETDATPVEIIGQSVATLLPDGRYITYIATSPRDDWSSYVNVAAAIMRSISFLRSTGTPAPIVGPALMSFAPGAVTFNTPEGWVENAESGINARTFYEQNALRYTDTSGYVNGPELVTLAVPMQANDTPTSALLRFLGLDSGTKLRTLTVGGSQALPAAELTTVKDISAHALTFVAFASQDGKTLNVFRWSSPGMLIEVLRPTLEGILESIKLMPAASVFAPPDFAAFAGIPVSATSDGALLIGSPDAPVRVINFMDFACPYCDAFFPTIHQFMLGYVKEGKATLEFRYLSAQGEISLLTGLTALCAGDQSKQVEMYELQIYLAQTQGASAAFTLDNLMTQAAQIGGLDVTALRSCITGGKYLPAMEATRVLADQIGISEVPTVLLIKESALVTAATATPVPASYTQFDPTQDLAALNAAVDQLVQ